MFVCYLKKENILFISCQHRLMVHLPVYWFIITFGALITYVGVESHW